MSLSFEQKLHNYAKIGLIHGLGLGQKARPLYIDAYDGEDQNNFISILAEEGYGLGSPTVDVRVMFPRVERAMFLSAPEEYRTNIPNWVSVRAQEIVDRDGARIGLNGNGSLGIMDDVDPKYPSALRSANFRANEPHTTRRMKMLQPWTILDVPTTAWANKLGTSIDDLWNFLFMITGADQEDPLAFAKETNTKLHRRTKLLTDLGIRTLHFLGDGTDLKIGLSSRARWCGGSEASEDGTIFEANCPSFEVYTTPDWRLTSGVVRVTMPSVIEGPIATDLSLTFENGRIVNFSASGGWEAFEALITKDQGASQLGEVALVGLDSPLSRFVSPHYCGLLDENKRCHIAVGDSYASCLKGGQTASPEELEQLGANSSDVHHDMMISDDTTSIVAYDAKGKVIAQLMKNGRWVGEFA